MSSILHPSPVYKKGHKHVLFVRKEQVKLLESRELENGASLLVSEEPYSSAAQATGQLARAIHLQYMGGWVECSAIACCIRYYGTLRCETRFTSRLLC